MITCREMDLALEHLLNGSEASGGEDASARAGRIAGHLRRCARCRALWERERSFAQTLRQAAGAAPALPPEAHGRLMRAIAQEPLPARRAAWRFSGARRLAWRILPAAAALFLLALGTLWFFRPGAEAARSGKRPGPGTPDSRSGGASARIASQIPPATEEAALAAPSRAALESFFSPPKVLVSVQSDVTWLAQSLISHPGSLMRAVGAMPENPRPSSSTPTRPGSAAQATPAA